MIVIAGTDYEQPTDKGIVAYDGGKYVLISSGDVLQRVLMAEFAEAGPPAAHDHEEDFLYPANIAAAPGLPYVGMGIENSYVRVYKDTEVSGLLQVVGQYQVVLSAGTKFEIYTNPAGGVNFRLEGGPNTRNAIADNWFLHPCSRVDKEDIEVISDPLGRVRQAEGITYTQDGVANVGVAAEDLDRLGLPNLTRKDENGKYEAINPLGTVALLLEAVKELESQLSALTSRVMALE